MNLQTVAETSVTKIEPEIDLELKFRPNDEFRGVAKIAFETVALMLGPQYVLSSEFEPIRAYIMGHVRLPDSIPPGDVAVDSRFVRRLGAEFKMNFTAQHGVLLYCLPPDLVGFVLPSMARMLTWFCRCQRLGIFADVRVFF